MSEYGLVEPFNIDNGELDGMTPQEVFVAGYQLARISEKAELSDGCFHMPFYVQNWDRIEAALIKRGRRFRMIRSPDDASETWCEVFVERK